jgi:oligopeptide/dipeptide ABC transporter ATP-binding protein
MDRLPVRSGGDALSANGEGRSEVLLTVEHLHKAFPVRRPLGARVRKRPRLRAVAVDDVSLEVRRGDTLGIVGESGSGKTTLARLLLRLLRADAGSIRFGGSEVTAADGPELRRIRRQMQMVFQDPYSSLNPRLKVGTAIAEPAVVHGVVSKDLVDEHVREMLSLVGLPETAAERYPRQLSGGQRQRVAIARALSVRPELLIADEPVSALDVSIQAQILNLLDDLLQSLGLTTVFIAHQLSVVRHISNRVAIMYLGRIVETGPTERVFESPQHPYTAGLLAAAPRPDPSTRHRKPAVRGDIPSSLRIPSGCRFRTRCTFAEERCALEDPALLEVEPDRFVACHVLPFRAKAPA